MSSAFDDSVAIGSLLEQSSSSAKIRHFLNVFLSRLNFLLAIEIDFFSFSHGHFKVDPKINIREQMKIN